MAQTTLINNPRCSRSVSTLIRGDAFVGYIDQNAPIYIYLWAVERTDRRQHQIYVLDLQANEVISVSPEMQCYLVSITEVRAQVKG